MFSWATEQFERISQTVAPPPTDAVGRFIYSVQRGDESAAQGCLAEMDPHSTVVQPSKGSYPLHLACQHGLERLIRQIMGIPGANIQLADAVGNTPLHYAAMSQKTTNVNVVRLLVAQYGASVVAKNAHGQTAYDVAHINGIRQFLLPLQLQQETQQALDNGGVGLPPGIDMGGLRIKNSSLPPPPTGPGSPPPQGGTAGMLTTPSPTMPPTSGQPIISPPAAPSSGGPHTYARVGGSSAAIFKSDSRVRADGFHSSSSDLSLQKKYGNTSAPSSGNAIPPPPSSGGVPPPQMSLASNPYSLGGGVRSRYLAYDGRTGQGAALPTANSYGNFQAAAVPPAPANFTMFNPAGGGTMHRSVSAPVVHAPAPLTNTFMPPPPYSGQPAVQPQNPAPAPAGPVQQQIPAQAAYSQPPPQQQSPYSPPPQQSPAELIPTTQQPPAVQNGVTPPPMPAPFRGPQVRSMSSPATMTSTIANAEAAANAFSSPSKAASTPDSTTAVLSSPPPVVSSPQQAVDAFASPAPRAAESAPVPTVFENVPSATSEATAAAFGSPAPSVKNAATAFENSPPTVAAPTQSAPASGVQPEAASVFGSVAPPSHQPVELATSVGSTHSAADLFSGPSPDKALATQPQEPTGAQQLFATPSPSKTTGEQPGTAAAFRALAPAPAVETIKEDPLAPVPAAASQNAAAFFGGPPTSTEAPKEDAANVFGSAPPSNVTETTKSLDESTDEGLMDVPLSPQDNELPPPPVATTTTTTQPTQSKTNSAAELFGLPPPPFSSK